MKYFFGTNHINFSWEEVATCFWVRYPNPYSTHVISEDTLSRKVVDGKLITHRLITKYSRIPKWAEMFIPGGLKKVCILEESIVDAKTKTLTTYTKNLGMAKVMMVDEKCIYKPNEINRKLTECERHAWVNSSIIGFASYGINKYKKSIVETLKGYEHVLNLTYNPGLIQDSLTLLELNKEKFKESKEKFKESAHKAKESVHKAKEIAKTKAKSSSVIA